jgi:hypothetical protein
VILRVPGAAFGNICGFVYFDAQAGLSVRGGPEGDKDLAALPPMTFRMPMGELVRALSDDEAAGRGLPVPPSWLEHYGPQPKRDAPWRTDPALLGKTHPSFPDDVQVVVHDGEPRRTGKRAEQCWVRITGARDGPRKVVFTDEKSAGVTRAAFDQRHQGHPLVYTGILLNQPHQLTTIRQGQSLDFYANGGDGEAVRVTAAYVEERKGWGVVPCNQCGFCEGLDPPTTMAKTRFPDAPADATVQQFSSKCPKCGGLQMFAADDAG